MEGIYEYLIGGKKTNKRSTPTFNDLKVGDIFYVYYYKKPNESIIRYKIEKIYKDTHNSMIDFECCTDKHWYLPLGEGTKTFHKNTEVPYTKIYFATAMSEFEKYIETNNIKIEDIGL